MLFGRSSQLFTRNFADIHYARGRSIRHLAPLRRLLPYQSRCYQTDRRKVAPQPNISPSRQDGVQHTGQPSTEDLERFFKQNTKYLRPVIFALCLSGSIYAFLAYLEAREESKPTLRRKLQHYSHGASATPTEVLSRAWENVDPITKLSYGIIAVNGAVHLGSLLVPNYWSNLSHTPALTVYRMLDYTLFTSTFVHFGSMHLLFNMWACYNFLTPTGYSRAFEGSPYHTLSFFLSAGVLSGYAQHLTTMFSRSASTVWVRSGGASGALFGVFGVFCTQYPNAGVGIMFVPFSIAASTMLPLVMAFDAYGMVRGIPRLNLGHAAHLSGTLLGVGYSYFDGKNRIWKPLVRFFKRRIHKTHS